MVTTTRAHVAAAVAAVRQIDVERGTDTAITDVAELMHLSPESVAEIARNAAHAEALIEDQHRSLTAVGANSLDLGNCDLVQVAKPACRGCGACKRTTAMEV